MVKKLPKKQCAKIGEVRVGEIRIGNGADARKSHVEGHRARLRERFMASSAALHDYELLELVLCMAQPRLDVKPISKELIKRFGSFAAVISAPGESLTEISGMGQVSVCALRVIKEAASRLLAPVDKGLALNSSRKVLEYCEASMAYQPTEQFRVLYLDNKNTLIKDELQE